MFQDQVTQILITSSTGLTLNVQATRKETKTLEYLKVKLSKNYP